MPATAGVTKVVDGIAPVRSGVTGKVAMVEGVVVLGIAASWGGAGLVLAKVLTGFDSASSFKPASLNGCGRGSMVRGSTRKVMDPCDLGRRWRQAQAA
jgi:hypothetical protein